VSPAGSDDGHTRLQVNRVVPLAITTKEALR
jgi:hypothetical protein